jgi:hypothetical protein
MAMPPGPLFSLVDVFNPFALRLIRHVYAVMLVVDIAALNVVAMHHKSALPLFCCRRATCYDGAYETQRHRALARCQRCVMLAACLRYVALLLSPARCLRR